MIVRVDTGVRWSPDPDAETGGGVDDVDDSTISMGMRRLSGCGF